jgi:hypothetical protein
VCFKKRTLRFFLSRLELVGPLLLCSLWLIPVALGWDNTSLSFSFFFSDSCHPIARWDLCVVVFGSVSSDCSPLGLYVPYALLYLLFASMVHTRHCLPLPDMLRCPPSSPSSPVSDLANTPLLVQKYIYHLRSLPLPSLFVITLSHLDSLRVLYCYC